ncbi:MAG TPA: zinc-binding dehydrogenase [Acidimicrobiales bacterium]|nr:zinc-binding dehydrogenase [Acidimicrobiales bacterium]
MRVAALREHQLVLEDRADPTPGPHDVVVEVRAAGINAADLLQRQGSYPAPPGWPEDVPGMELSGVVVKVGAGVEGSLLGRRVCAIVGGGAQATHCVVPSEHLLFVPEQASWLEAGGFAEAFVTAHDALVTQGGLHAGQRVAISGAAGGVGSAAVQIAHALGATVVAVTRDTTPHEQLRALGADETVTVDELDAVEPVDVVLELVGAPHFSRVFSRLAPFARVVVIGVGAGSLLEVDLRTIMVKRLTLTGSTLRARSREEKTQVIERVAQTLLPLWRSGDLHVELSRVFDLEQIAEAYDYFAESGKFGKVIVHVSD